MVRSRDVSSLLKAVVARKPKAMPVLPAPTERGVAPRLGRPLMTIVFAPRPTSVCTPFATLTAAVNPAVSMLAGFAAVAGDVSTGIRSFAPKSTVNKSVFTGAMARAWNSPSWIAIAGGRVLDPPAVAPPNAKFRLLFTLAGAVTVSASELPKSSVNTRPFENLP